MLKDLDVEYMGIDKNWPGLTIINYDMVLHRLKLES